MTSPEVVRGSRELPDKTTELVDAKNSRRLLSVAKKVSEPLKMKKCKLLELKADQTT